MPIAILAISDLLLPAYNSLGVLVIKYVAMSLPVVFGRWLASGTRGWAAFWRLSVCGLAPATIFFFTTNLAVWVFQSDYPKTFAGLVECYAAGVPFFRAMLAGDLYYLAVFFGCAALAGQRILAAKPVGSAVT